MLSGEEQFLLSRLTKTYFFVIFLTILICLRVSAEDFNGTINSVNVKSAGNNSVVVDVYVNSKDPKLKPKVSSRKYRGDKYVIDLMNVTQKGGVQKDTSSSDGLVDNKDVKVGKVSGGTARVLINLPDPKVNIKEVRYHVLSDKEKPPATDKTEANKVSSKDTKVKTSKNNKTAKKTEKKEIVSVISAKQKVKKTTEKAKIVSIKPKTLENKPKNDKKSTVATEIPKPTVVKIVDKNKAPVIASPVVVHKTSAKETKPVEPAKKLPEVVKKNIEPIKKPAEIPEKTPETTKKITEKVVEGQKQTSPFADVRSKVYSKPKVPAPKKENTAQKMAENNQKQQNKLSRPEIKVPDAYKDKSKPKIVSVKPESKQTNTKKPEPDKTKLVTKPKELSVPNVIEAKTDQKQPVNKKVEQSKTTSIINPSTTDLQPLAQAKPESSAKAPVKSDKKVVPKVVNKNLTSLENSPIDLNSEDIKQTKDNNEKDKKSDMTSTFFTLIGALVIVLPLIFLTVWIINLIHKSGNPLAGFNSLSGLNSNKFNIISSITLGQGRSIHLVEIKGRQLVIGCTNNNITILTEFEDYDNFIEGPEVKEETVKEPKKQVTENSLKYKKSRPPLGSFADLYKDYKNKTSEKDLEDEY